MRASTSTRRGVLAWMTAVVIQGCAGGEAGDVALVVEALSASDVARVAVTIEGPGIAPAIEQDLVAVGAQWQGAIGGIPAGSDRVFTVVAYDAGGVERYRGVATGIEVIRNGTITVLLVLQQSMPPERGRNSPPRIDTVQVIPGVLAPGETASVLVSASDPDPGDSLTYAWDAADGAFADPGAASTTWTAPMTDGTYRLTITVRDRAGSRRTVHVDVPVGAAHGRGTARIGASLNTWPEIARFAADPGLVGAGETSTLLVETSDADGDAVDHTYTSDCGGSFVGTTFVAPGSVPAEGITCTLTLRASDGRGGEAIADAVLYVGTEIAANHGPVIDSTFQSRWEAGLGDDVSIDVGAYDVDGDVLTFTWTATSGTLGVATSSATTSSATWTSSGGDATIVVRATDPGGAFAEAVFEIADPFVPDPACATSAPKGALGLRVTPPAANVAGAGSTALRVDGFFADDPTVPLEVTSSVAWASSAPSIVTVDAAGQAVWSGAPGIATLTATLHGRAASTTIRVWDAARLADVTSLALEGIPSNLSSGECHQARVVATFGAGGTEDVTASAQWIAAGRARVLDGGLYAADGNGGEGYHDVTAYLVAGGVSVRQTVGIWGPIFQGTCSDPRVPGALWAVRLSTPSTSMFVGEAVPTTALGIYEDGSRRDITTRVDFGVCSPVMAITDEGLAIARATGTGGVIASLDGVLGSSPAITITDAPALGTLTAIELYPSAANLALGDTYRLTALGTYSGAPGRRVDVTSSAAWSSSDATVATIAGGAGAATRIDLATIGATLGGHSAHANVRVWDAARLASITGLRIGVPLPNITGGACQQLQLIATFDGDPMDTLDVADSAIWTPRVSPRGTVSETGHFVAGPSTGYALVYASLGRDILVPVGTEIGVWGSGGTCP